MSFIGEWRFASFLGNAGKQFLQKCENSSGMTNSRMLSGVTKASVQKGTSIQINDFFRMTALSLKAF